MPGFARIIDSIPLGQNLGRFVFQVAQRFVQRSDRHAAELDRVQLLEAVQGTGHGGVLDGGDGAERHELSVRAADIDVLDLVRVKAVLALDLRNDLVAAAGDVEAVDEIAADHGADVSPDLFQVQAQIRHFVAVDDKFRLGLVDLHVDNRRKGKESAHHRLLLQLPGELQDLFGLGRGGQDELHRELAAAGERGG